MGDLQPGLLSLAMIPAGFVIKIIDLKNCFFIIPLHDNDKENFALTLPSLNNENQLTYINGKYYLKAWKTVPPYVRPMSMLLLHPSTKISHELNVFITWMIF
jgi:hypothetical protein